MAALTPLNGTKTHPLTEHTVTELANICETPLPRCTVNPGVVNRLLREELVTIESRPSPFPTRKGNIDFLVATDKGRAVNEGGEICRK